MLTAKEINTKSREIAMTAKGLGKEIHNHLLSIMAHVEAHKDVSVAFTFLKLIQNNNKEGEKHSIVRDEAIKNWLQDFAFAKLGKTKDGKDGMTLTKLYQAASVDGFKEHNLVAKRTPWNVYTPAKAYPIFDLDAAIASLVKRAADKANEEGPNGEKNKVNPDRLAALKALAETIA